MSFVLPLTRGIAAARLVIAGASLRLVTPRIAGEQVIGAAYALPGCFLFRSFEFQAKKRGKREAFYQLAERDPPRLSSNPGPSTAAVSRLRRGRERDKVRSGVRSRLASAGRRLRGPNQLRGIPADCPTRLPAV